MTGKYILDEHGIPKNEPDLIKWAKWFEKAERRVDVTQIGESKVSTVFLGLDHSYNDGSPVLWETMVFGGPLDQKQERCSGTKEQAETMHLNMVQLVKEGVLNE